MAVGVLSSPDDSNPLLKWEKKVGVREVFGQISATVALVMDAQEKVAESAIFWTLAAGQTLHILLQLQK
jgi:hypothetical protein